MTPTPTTDSAVSPVRELKPRSEMSRPELYAMIDDLQKTVATVAGRIRDGSLSRRSLDTADGVEPCATEGCGKRATQYFEAYDIGSHYCDDCAGKIGSLASRAPNTEMVVKALEWDENGDAKTSLATYHVERGMFGWQWSAFTGAGGFAGAKPLGSEAEAKATAQADFDQRIRSALASPPSPAEVMTRDAIYILEWIAAPRPPTHPAEMNGVQSFPSIEAAVRFFARSPDDTKFVSISERVTVSSDKSDEFRLALAALQLNKKG